MAHSWFQFVLAASWIKTTLLDGWKVYIIRISNLAMNKILPPKKAWSSTWRCIQQLHLFSKINNDIYTRFWPLWFMLAYSISAGKDWSVFSTIRLLIGQENLNKTIKRYYNEYKFTHPTPNDIKRVAEKGSSANLDWYSWTNKLQIRLIVSKKFKMPIKPITKVVLKEKGRMPMPLDVMVEYTDGTKEFFYIPNTR